MFGGGRGRGRRKRARFQGLSRARSREQEVDTGDRNKEGPLVFTQQVNLCLHTTAGCMAGNYKCLETIAWRHLLNGMFLDVGQHSGLLRELK